MLVIWLLHATWDTSSRERLIDTALCHHGLCKASIYIPLGFHLNHPHNLSTYQSTQACRYTLALSATIAVHFKSLMYKLLQQSHRSITFDVQCCVINEIIISSWIIKMLQLAGFAITLHDGTMYIYEAAGIMNERCYILKRGLLYGDRSNRKFQPCIRICLQPQLPPRSHILSERKWIS